MPPRSEAARRARSHRRSGVDRDVLLRPVDAHDDIGDADAAAACRRRGSAARCRVPICRVIPRDRRRRAVVDPEAQAVRARACGPAASRRRRSSGRGAARAARSRARSGRRSRGRDCRSAGSAGSPARRFSSRASRICGTTAPVGHDAGVARAGAGRERPQLLAPGVDPRQAAAARRRRASGSAARASCPRGCRPRSSDRRARSPRVHAGQARALDVAPPADVERVRAPDVRTMLPERLPTDVPRRRPQRELERLRLRPAGTSIVAGASRPGALTDQVPPPPPASLELDRLRRPACPAARARTRRPRARRTGRERRRPARRSCRRPRRARSSGACAPVSLKTGRAVSTSADLICAGVHVGMALVQQCRGAGDRRASPCSCPTRCRSRPGSARRCRRRAPRRRA